MPKDSTLVGADGLRRCAWAGADSLYQQYHDLEWGRPVRSEAGLYERLCLEGFQSGLSWLTILRKREGFRQAFDGFDPDTVSQFTEADVDRLVQDAAIVRHRAKIQAAIGNARATVALRAGYPGGLASLFWAAAEPTVAAPPRDLAQVPSRTPASVRLAKALKGYGFSFVGPTTVYAAMQACGVVNDHVLACHRAGVEVHE